MFWFFMDCNKRMFYKRGHVFSPNTEKHRPEKLRIRTLFMQRYLTKNERRPIFFIQLQIAFSYTHKGLSFHNYYYQS